MINLLNAGVYQGRTTKFKTLAFSLVALLATSLTSFAQDADPTPAPPAPPALTPAPPPAAQPETPPAKDLPDAKEIVAASLSPIGETEKLDNIKTFSVKATLTGPMGDVHFDLKSARSGAFVLRQSMEGMPESTVGYNGTVAWVGRPDMQFELVDKQTLEQGKQQFNILFPYWMVFAPDDHYQSLQTVDQIKFNDEECYKIRAKTGTTGEEIETYLYYDVNKKMIRGVSIQQITPMGPMDAAFEYGEWKTVDDLNVFSKITVEQMGQPLALTYNEIAFNTVEETAFELPDEVKELVKKQEAEAATPAPSEPTPAPAPPPTPTPEPAPANPDNASDDQ